jgi:hypothetical protein
MFARLLRHATRLFHISERLQYQRIVGILRRGLSEKFLGLVRGIFGAGGGHAGPGERQSARRFRPIRGWELHELRVGGWNGRRISGRILWGRGWHAQNAVVTVLRVGYVQGLYTRHVADGAILLLNVMLGGKLIAMTIQTFCAIVRDAFGGLRRRVGVVASGAGERVARGAFANALRQGFELADGAQFLFSVTCEDVVAHELGEIVAGAKLIEVAAGLFDDGVAFEMTLHADGVASHGIQFRGIDDAFGRAAGS